MNTSSPRRASLSHPLPEARPRPACPTLLAVLLATLLAGCSSFNRDWKAAAAGGAASDPLAGRWEGTWRSDVNAHTGELRCLITPATNGTYTARFQAKYRKLVQLTFSYTVSLAVTNREDGHHFQGEADLGWLAGGRYPYRGRATATRFHSTYACPHDHGIFEMTRPPDERP